MAAAEEVSAEELLRQMSLARQAVEHARQQAQLHVSAVLQGNEEAEDMCIDPASAATITRVLAYSARTFPLDCDVYLERFSLCDSC
jgi:hypothetical protein